MQSIIGAAALAQRGAADQLQRVWGGEGAEIAADQHHRRAQRIRTLRADLGNLVEGMTILARGRMRPAFACI